MLISGPFFALYHLVHNRGYRNPNHGKHGDKKVYKKDKTTL